MYTPWPRDERESYDKYKWPRDEREWSRARWRGPGRLSTGRTRLVAGQAADPHEDEIARAHLEGAEPADLLDSKLGPQRFGARFRVRSESEVTEAPQPCTVEAMCKANWPAQRRSTEAERILEKGLREQKESEARAIRPEVLRGGLLGRRPSRRVAKGVRGYHRGRRRYRRAWRRQPAHTHSQF
jgi:hypothetical protein